MIAVDTNILVYAHRRKSPWHEAAAGAVLELALHQVDLWAESPSMLWLGESSRTWPVVSDLLRTASVGGARVHDARIAAICLANGVRELWTADRDYSRFPAVRTRNPLAA